MRFKNSVNVFSKALLLCLFITTASVSFAQPTLPQKYVLREKQATPEVRTQLQTQRSLIKEKKLAFNVGFTSVSARKLEEITGEKEAPEDEVVAVKQYITSRKLSPAILAQIGTLQLVCKSTNKTYDARNNNYVSGIRNQQCGNCWVYSAVGAFEGSYLKVNGGAPANIDCSERYAQWCSGGGTCGGGLAYQVFKWMVDNNKNLPKDALYPDMGTDGACPASAVTTNYYATAWGIVDPSNDINKIASVTKIKEALCKYGPIAASVQATSLFQNYTNGVFFEFASNYASPSSNHAIVIVGWDDNKGAWLIKNSWNTSWGENGFMWIKYNSNNIGRRAAWVLAKKAKRVIFVPKKQVITTLPKPTH